MPFCRICFFVIILNNFALCRVKKTSAPAICDLGTPCSYRFMMRICYFLRSIILSFGVLEYTSNQFRTLFLPRTIRSVKLCSKLCRYNRLRLYHYGQQKVDSIRFIPENSFLFHKFDCCFIL